MNKMQNQNNRNTFLCCAIGVGVSLACALVILFICSAFAMMSADPASVSPIGYAVFLLCAVLGGFVSSKRCKKNTVLCGIISGVIYTLCVVCTSSLIADGVGTWLLVPASVICSVIGALLAGANTFSSKPKRPNFKYKK